MSYESNQDSGLLRVGSIIQGLRAKACILGICLGLLMVMVGCHSGPANTTNIPAPAVSIALGTAPSSLTVGQTYQFTATVTNSTNTAVTWSAGGVTGGNATVGTISSSGLYTAPVMMPSPASVTIMATSQADTTKSVSTSVTINISLALNLSSASVQVTGTQQFTATILGTTNTDVTWTVNGVAGGNSTLGTISNTGLYTAPAYPPSPTTVTVTATSVAESSIAVSSMVTVAAPPISVSVNPTALDLQVGHTVQFSDVVATSSTIPISTAVTWGASAPADPGNGIAGTISSTGKFTAPTRIPLLNPVKVYVVSQEDPTKSAIAYVTVTTAPVLLTISTNSMANGVVNSPYSATVSGYGGAQPYAWSITGGALPTGLALNSSSGVISGTPTTAGTTNFTITVTDQSPTPQTQTANLSITIIPQLSITTTSLSNGAVGSGYTSTLNATGGVTPYTWSITTGSLPAGLALNASSGAITGTPATGSAGAYPITVKVTDAGTPQQSQTFSTTITIYTGLTITTTSLPNDVMGTAYNQSVTAVGGTTPYTWSYTGTLPPGLTLTPSGASYALAGTPTTAGTYSFTVQAVDSSNPPQTKTQALSIIVYTALSFPTVTLPNGVVNTAYSTSLLAASGGTAPYTYSIVPGSGSLPAGLLLNLSTGVISGTPTTGGSSTFGVKVADSSIPAQTHTQAVSITIYTVLTITSTSLPNGTVNSSYSATLTSGGGTGAITWSVSNGSLPANLTLTPSTGVISGIPAAAATTSFTVTATDSGNPQQTKNQLLSITVNPVLSITTTTLPSSTVGASYSQNIQTNGGTLPVKWSVTGGSLPPGLKLQGQGTSGVPGTISGTPTAASANPYSFTVTATDSSVPPVAVNQALSITINNVPLAITTTSLPNGTLGVAYAGAQLNATGGTMPYKWGLSGTGTFPPCFYLSASGAITTPGTIGTPCVAQTYNFGVTVTDSTTPTAQTNTAMLSITINPTAAAACTDTGSESLLHGQYAFTLSGYNPSGFEAVVGSFTADGTGKITAGVLDSNGTLVQSAASIDTTNSSYSVGANHLGCATIVTSAGTFTTRLAVGAIASNVAAAGRMVEWDDPNSSTYYAAMGQLLKQTVPTNLPSGSYAYQYTGVYGTSQYNTGVVGMITADASTNKFTYGEYDINVDGLFDLGTTTPYSGITGTYTTPDPTTGRYTTATTLSGITANHVAYLVSSSQYLEMSTDALSANTSVLVGQGQLQTPPTGGFGSGSVNGNFVFYWTGQNGGSTGGAAQLGLGSGAGNGSMNVTTYEDDAGTWKAPNPGTATCGYTVDSYGRMTFTAGSNCGGALYLTAADSAFLLTPDSDVGTGQVVPQVVPTGGFTSASFSGTYYMGDDVVVNYGVASAVEIGINVITFNGSGGSGVNDYTALAAGGGQQADQTQTMALPTINSDGTFSTKSSGIVDGIMVSGTEAVVIDNEKQSYPMIQVVKQ